MRASELNKPIRGRGWIRQCLAYAHELAARERAEFSAASAGDHGDSGEQPGESTPLAHAPTSVVSSRSARSSGTR